MNRLFVANKPSGISSNRFLSILKHKYGVKKAGFSGTLDPFASGCLIVAFDEFTKFFRFLDKSPKTYIATMWLGVKSQSGDNENIVNIQTIASFSKEKLELTKKSLLGKILYTPPKFSAKKINGKKAYDMARKGEEFELKKSEMEIYECEILNYMHPFLTFKISVSEGAYIRSYTQLFAKKLGVDASLSALHRVSEGRFVFENEKSLNPLEFLNLKQNFYKRDFSNIAFGKKLKITDFINQNNGKYLIKSDSLSSILEIKDGAVSYLLNRIEI